MNWHTEECINWFLNDEGLYRMSATAFIEYFKEFPASEDIDLDEVDWDEVENFIDEERNG